MRAEQRDLADNFGHDTTLPSKSDLRAELGSDYCHGALLDRGDFLVGTLHGTIRATQVTAATDAYTDKAMPWFRKRLINVGSFVIVTEPLGEERARQLIPDNRVVVPSRTIGHCIRITPDNRLAFGGRALFAPSDPASDVKSGDVLKREMTEIFPQWPG
ncbi:FAD-dependent oxidoreductase [Streptomyces sp. NPDC002130]|uniref:FAD-dependent oxidoreductase n=1 Tax=Streptomyces sp. NPDC002130 TaxID=3155568 RepID=UPI00331CFBC5